jgi:hypothetical protein
MKWDWGLLFFKLYFVKDDVGEISNGILREYYGTLWTLLLRNLRSNNFMVVVLITMHLILAVMFIRGSTIHPCWISDICSMSYFLVFFVIDA